MSSNLQTDVMETKPCASIEQVSTNCELHRTPSTVSTQSTNGVCDRQQSLVEKANNTFHELCKTLENEQAKLLELEERRKKLQEEMLLLKAEIEVEKQSFNLNIVQSVADNLSKLNKTNDGDDKDSDLKQVADENINCNNLCTCYEDEEHMPSTARTLAPKNSRQFMNEQPTTIQEHAQCIRNELQNVLTECLTERNENICE